MAFGGGNEEMEEDRPAGMGEHVRAKQPRALLLGPQRIARCFDDFRVGLGQMEVRTWHILHDSKQIVDPAEDVLDRSERCSGHQTSLGFPWAR
jgi:hypothetical protein